MSYYSGGGGSYARGRGSNVRRDSMGRFFAKIKNKKNIKKYKKSIDIAVILCYYMRVRKRKYLVKGLTAS